MPQSPCVVLITGANSGVGLAITKILTSQSIAYHVIISARTLLKAQTAKAEAEAENPSAASRLSCVQLDVTDSASIALAAEYVEKEFGHLDALLNNAAVGATDLDWDVEKRFRAAMDVNVIGVAVVADVFRPLLLKSPKPYSIFVSSGAGSFSRAVERYEGRREKGPEPKNGGAYHVSKAALNMLALREHHEFAEKGLRVFAMSPGFVVSNLRGTSEELRSGWGKAGLASVSGEIILMILEGERDEDAGKLVWEKGVYGW